MAGDGEDGRDGVEGEDDVSELDGDEGEEEDGDHAVAVFVDERTCPGRRLTGWTRASQAIQRGCGSPLFCRREGRGGRRDEEDGGEEIADPVEASEQAEDRRR